MQETKPDELPVDFRKMLDHRFLAGEDLAHQIAVTIERLKQETMQDGERRKWVAYFRGKVKGATLCNESLNVLASLLGADPHKWIGKAILIEGREGKWFGKRQKAVRVVNRLPTTPTRAAQAADAPPQPAQADADPPPPDDWQPGQGEVQP